MSVFEKLQITILKALYGDPTEGELKPQISLSGGYNRWFTFKGDNTCKYCKKKNGSVFLKNERVLSEERKEIPPVHNNCRCIILPLLAIFAATATVDTILGVDYYLKYKGMLPDNYVDKKEAELRGWDSRKGNLRDVIKNGTMGGDPFKNDKGKLPLSQERTWQEADINYSGGYRNKQRVLYFNDGLIFVTYDHYETFFEIN